MSSQDRDIERLEESFPKSAGRAFAAAYKRAIAAGLSVVVGEDGVVWRVYPDGTRKKLKELPRSSGKKYPKRISLR